MSAIPQSFSPAPPGHAPETTAEQRFSRIDQSLIGRWWWTVDRWMLGALLVLILVGAVVSLAASPAVAERINTASDFALAQRHLMLLPIAALAMIILSILPVAPLRRLTLIAFPIGLLLLAVVPIVGIEIKGGTRWINFLGFSLQPTEFIKPLLVILCAWLMSIHINDPRFPGRRLTLVPLIVVVLLVVTQPDLGQTVVISSVWAVQLFLAGLPMLWILAIAGLAIAGAFLAYNLLDHVRGRIDSFINPNSTNDRYQIERSLDSFRDGGLFGKGPGEGSIKAQLPDAHADFIFAVIGEEFGLIVCMLVLLIVAFVVLRGLFKALRATDPFVRLALAGLVVQFGVQASINMATALHLIPTKGMTLPFVSYGGSSLLATGFAMGIVLALTRSDVPVVAGPKEL